MLPPQSQAFAAVLTRAFNWIQRYDRKTYEEISKMFYDAHPRYSFGQTGEPDFAAAEKIVAGKK